jgi:hypothetical protein
MGTVWCRWYVIGPVAAESLPANLNIKWAVSAGF